MKDNFNVAKETENIINWIKSLNIKGAVVGISGGKDSTVVSALLVEALGIDNVYGVLMPNGVQKDIEDSKKVVEYLGIAHQIVNIGEAYRSLLFNIGTSNYDARINIAPRLRMTTLYAIGQTLGYRVAGTGNASEAYIGYTTKWGDNACDFNPIAEYTSTEVVAIGIHLGLDKSLVLKTPSDGLSGMSDEEKLGVSYCEINAVIDCNEHSEISESSYQKINKMHNYSRHKFEPIPKCTPKYKAILETNNPSGETFNNPSGICEF